MQRLRDMSERAKKLLNLDETTDPATYTGWILPNGKTLPANCGTHHDTAAAVGEKHPEAAGWIHVRNGIVCPPNEGTVTPRQSDTIVALSISSRVTLPYWLADAVG